jgi:hypothetical protein
MVRSVLHAHHVVFPSFFACCFSATYSALSKNRHAPKIYFLPKIGLHPKHIFLSKIGMCQHRFHGNTRTNREFRMNTNIGDFNMGDIILDFGSEVNVLPKKKWECMGEPTLGYPPIQFKLENQHRVISIG